MSDGREERKEKELHRQEDAKKDRSDWIDHDYQDQWQPERRES